MSRGQREMTYEELKYAYMKKVQRVQELEEELYGNDIQMGYKRMYGVCNRDYVKLLQQNKRYREANEEIKKTADDYRAGHLLDIQDSFFVDEIIVIINKLESELDG